VLSAASNYQQFILQTGTALHETDQTFEFLVGPNRDVYAIKKSNTATNSTEVHRLSAASNYQQFTLQTGTALHETDQTFQFAFAEPFFVDGSVDLYDGSVDLYAIKKSNSGTNSTEVHRLSAASNYQQFTLQTGTVLHETDATWEFGITAGQDLLGVKKSGTGTHSTEVHIVRWH
jgi:hypothetical protein